MQVKKTLLILLSCTPSIAFCQSKNIDSLRQALSDHSQQDTTRFRILIDMSDQFAFSDPDESRKCLNEALDIANELGLGKYIAEVHASLTHYFWNRMDYAQALDHGLKSLTKYELVNYPLGIYSASMALAGIYLSLGDFKTAELYFDKTMKLAESNPGMAEYNILYFNFAWFRIKQNRMAEAIDLLNKAIKINQEQNKYYDLSNCYFLLAKINEKESPFATVVYFESAIRYSKMSSDPQSLSQIGASHQGIAAAYIRLKKYNQAILHLDTALQAGQQGKSPNIVINTYNTLAQAYEATGNLKMALESERLKQALKDSVLNQEKSRQVAEVQTKYETEKKEQEIVLLEQKNKTQTVWRNSLMAGLLLTITSAAIIYWLQRTRVHNAKQFLETKELLVEQMQQADKVKSRFFANISHEFRTPLTLILSPIEEKLLTGDLSQKDKISFQSVKRSANRLLQLVNQILELSKLESGFMKLNVQPGNLHNFIMPILSSFDSMADVSQLRYSKDIRVLETVLLFDADKLEKILNNLLSNAFKFSPKGSPVQVSVVTIEKAEDVDVQIEIRNHYFIEPNTLDKIFEPFFQGEYQSPQGMPGTGLGLPLVKELVKLHGGNIHVTSNENDGTLFTVNFKFEKSQEIAVTPQEVNKDKATFSIEETVEYDIQSLDKARETILIVEDNIEVRVLIKQGLQSDYNVVEASTGKEGMALAQSENIDLVISDVMMPVMNGIEFCHLLKNNEITSHIPVILLTARADHESKLEGLRTGADDYITKPFNMQELLARIVNLIEQRKKLIQKYKQTVIIQPHEITVTPLDERFIQKALTIMEQNLDNTDFDIDKFSESIGMSRTNLHRKLKSITGLATNEFIQDFRLRRAAHLIEKKADTIAQIAYRVGFNDQSYFTKCFKKKFGKTPSEFADQVV
jgi:signal transduction histidine kinase/DNA-binding response OmpR family regulator